MPRQWLVSASLVLVLGLGLAAPGAGAVESFKNACRLDTQLFCSEVDPESPRGEFERCLRANMETLTESCRAVLDPSSVPKPVRRYPPNPFDVCRDDFRRLCPRVQDRMEAARCVSRQMNSLSADCREAIESATRRPGSGSKAPGTAPAP